MRLAGISSQGCTPIGETWTLTKVERNIIHRIGNRPAYEVLAETFNHLPPQEKQKAQGNLFIGLVVNEYLEDFHRGTYVQDGRRVTWKSTAGKGHLEQWTAFVQAIRNGGEAPVKFAELAGSTWATLKVIESLRCGEAIEL